MKDIEQKIEYELYCLYHKKVIRRRYGKQIDGVTFVKMDNGPYIFKSKKHIFLQHEPYFIKLGKEWVEYEFYYSLYKAQLKGSISLPEYLGFIQYDMEFKSCEKGKNHMSVIDYINKLFIEKKMGKESAIIFQPMDFSLIYRDCTTYYLEKEPKEENIVFENYIDQIILECNQLTGANLKNEDLIGRRLGICGSFFVHRDVFMKAMELLSKVIEDGRLNGFNKPNRTQGTLSERYLAVFLETMNLNKFEFPLVHHFETSSNQSLMFNLKKNIGLIGIWMRRNTPRTYFFIKKFLK